MQPQRAAKRRAVPSVRASARDRSPRYPRNPTRARGRSRIQCARQPARKRAGFPRGGGQAERHYWHSMGHAPCRTRAIKQAKRAISAREREGHNPI